VKLSAKDFVSDKPLQFLDKARQEQVIETALNIARGNQSRCNDFVLEMRYRKENVARHDAEWHKKFTLSVACIVLFFIGAPLGAIIKRGGFGLPFVASVLIFIFYYVLSTIGEKAVKQLTLTPFWGMWLSTIVLIPIGIFLTIKANNDSKLFNRDAYYLFFQRLKSVFKKSS
jgi:lipopolysaccharide export system permease protein